MLLSKSLERYIRCHATSWKHLSFLWLCNGDGERASAELKLACPQAQGLYSPGSTLRDDLQMNSKYTSNTHILHLQNTHTPLIIEINLHKHSRLPSNFSRLCV